VQPDAVRKLRTLPTRPNGVGYARPFLLAALAVVSSLIVVAAATDSSPTYLAGSILCGIGFGAAFVGAPRALLAKIPAQLIKTAADTSMAAAA
jgi:hypothetical protein